MFTVPDIYISNNTAFNGNLYPDHIFEWKFNGINCAAEDYTIGGTNTWQTTFKTDVKIDPAAELRIGGSSGYLMTITDNSRDNSSQNFYNITAVPSKVFELDAFLDDNFIEYDDPETLAHLMNRIGWTISGVSGIPYDYTINSKWAAQGMTKRQVIGLICQMLGANMASWIDTTPTLFILNGAAPATISYTPRTVKKITVADYLAPGINKIWFGTDGTDVGIAYGTGAQDQQLTLPYNALIDPDSEDNDDLLQYIYAKVNGYSYHPVKLETFLAEAPTFAQLIGTTTIPTVSYTDEDSNVYSFPIFNWEVSPSGCVMEATGNSDRSVANQLVSSEIATNGKYNKFKRTLDSTVSEIADLNGDVSALNQTAASLTLSVAGKVGYDEVISSINQTAETISINANKINLNGAVTANNNVTIGVDGVISAVGATLTNVHINGGNINIQSGNLNNNAIILKDSSGTYQAAFRPSGFETKYNNLTTASMDSYGGINSYYREIPGVVDTSSYQFGCWGGTKYKGRSYLRFDGLGIQGGPNGPTDFNRNGSRGYFNIDVGTGRGSSYTPTYNTNITIEKWGNGSISKDVCLDVDGLKFNDSNGNVVAEYNRNGASVIGRGTTSGWQWRRWSNGWTECWTAKHYQNINITSGWGSVYYGEIPKLAYPVTFKTNTFYPREIVSVEGGDTSASSHITVFLANVSPGTSASYSGKYLVMRPTSASDADFWVDYYVFGIEDR